MVEAVSSSKPLQVEYRVKAVTRYIVTRYERVERPDGGQANTRGLGEFPTYQQAYDIGYALAKSEHEQRGWEPGDARMRYPEMLPAAPVERLAVPPYEVTR